MSIAHADDAPDPHLLDELLAAQGDQPAAGAATVTVLPAAPPKAQVPVAAGLESLGIVLLGAAAAAAVYRRRVARYRRGACASPAPDAVRRTPAAVVGLATRPWRPA